MKKLVILVVAFILLPGSIFAQHPVGYIGLFVDSIHSTSCVTGDPLYPTQMYIICWPSYLGQMCAEFMISYPANVIQSTVTDNTAIISVTLGTLNTGMSVCYHECQWAWHWNFHQELWVTNTDRTFCEILPHPDSGGLQFANCEPDFTLEPCTAISRLVINYDETEPECCPCGQCPAKSASWGAIKSMFGE